MDDATRRKVRAWDILAGLLHGGATVMLTWHEVGEDYYGSVLGARPGRAGAADLVSLLCELNGTPEMKWCQKCCEDKPRAQFADWADSGDGKMPYCLECERARAKENYGRAKSV